MREHMSDTIRKLDPMVRKLETSITEFKLSLIHI